MIRKIATALLLLCLGTTSFAMPKEERGLLWEVSGNNLKKPSYLFGTHHLAPLSFLDSIDGLEKAFMATEQTVGELDMNNANEIQMELMIASLMGNEYSYKELLNDDDRNILDETLKKYIGGGLDQFEKMKPAMLNTLLSVMMYKEMYPTDEGEISMDAHFQNKARGRQLPIVALEVAQDQIEVLFESQTIERQAESLICNIKNIDYGKKQMSKLMKAYYGQDLTTMAKMYEEDDPNNPCPNTQEEKDELNKARNEKWIKKIPEIIGHKSSFIAVGCLHLVGEAGLINLLREAGYSVKSMYN